MATYIVVIQELLLLAALLAYLQVQFTSLLSGTIGSPFLEKERKLPFTAEWTWWKQQWKLKFANKGGQQHTRTPGIALKIFHRLNANQDRAVTIPSVCNYQASYVMLLLSPHTSFAFISSPASYCQLNLLWTLFDMWPILLFFASVNCFVCSKFYSSSFYSFSLAGPSGSVLVVYIFCLSWHASIEQRN